MIIELNAFGRALQTKQTKRKIKNKVNIAMRKGFGIKEFRRSPEGQIYMEHSDITLKEKEAGFYIKPENKKWINKKERVLTKE